jgi:rhodanese-related sulfurtransferase
MSMIRVTRISPTEAFAKMSDEGYAYVDVRTPEEFADGRPAGAELVPWGDDGDDFVARLGRRFASDAPIIVGCRSGVRSFRAAEALAAAGFTRVLEQRAGFDGARGPFGELTEPGWSRVGLPCEREGEGEGEG